MAAAKKGAAHPAQGAGPVQGQAAAGTGVAQGAVVPVFQAVAAVELLVILTPVVQGDQRLVPQVQVGVGGGDVQTTQTTLQALVAAE